MPVFYVVRYLPPKEVGEGEIVFAVSTTKRSEEEEEETLARLRETYPEKFEEPGFYHLLVSMSQYITVAE